MAKGKSRKGPVGAKGSPPKERRIDEALKAGLDGFHPEEMIRPISPDESRKVRRRQKDYNWDIVIGETD